VSAGILQVLIPLLPNDGRKVVELERILRIICSIWLLLVIFELRLVVSSSITLVALLVGQEAPSTPSLAAQAPASCRSQNEELPRVQNQELSRVFRCGG
jgi:hypothetical protein